MKDYKNLMKQLEKNDEFTLTKSPRKRTIKVIHTLSGKLYSVHPSNNAVQPLKNWMRKIKHTYFENVEINKQE